MSRCRIVPSRRFRADLRKIQQNGGPLDQIAQTVEALAAGERPSGTDRPLGENLSGCRECAVAPGYLLVYRYWGNFLVLYLMKTPKNAGGFSMFLLTEIKYRLLRARGRAALLLCIAALLVGSMAFYLGNIQANRSALEDLAQHIPVTARVVSRNGSKRDMLCIDTAHFDGFCGLGVHDVLTTTTFSGITGQVPKPVAGEDFMGGDTTVKGANCLEALKLDEEQLEFMEGYSQDFLAEDEALCLVSESYAGEHGLAPGDPLSMPLYAMLYGDMRTGYYDVGEHSMTVIGTYAGYGADLIVPVGWLRAITQEAGVAFTYESLSAQVDEPMELNAFKQSLIDSGFLETFDTAGDAYTGDAVIMEDEMFIKTAGELSQNLEVFDGFLLPFFALIIAMITLATFLVLRGSRQEIAIASSLGRQKFLNAASHFLGAIIAELVGCIAALPLMCVLVDMLPVTALGIVGVYMFCACIGTALALGFILRFDPLELLTKTD